MTTFIIVAAAMVAAALLWLLLPLWRTPAAEGKAGEGANTRSSARTISTIAIAIVVPALAALMYAQLSNWDWDQVAADMSRSQELAGLQKQLEARLEANPDDANGWLLLGRLHSNAQRYAQAVEAYQRAYDLTNGENIDAALGLGEALAMTDESALGGRASELFEEVLARAPNHPQALWYAGIAALHSGDLRKARDRLQSLLALNPPQDIRGVLERQVQDLNQQIGEDGERTPAAGEGAAAGARRIRVAVSLAPEIQQKLNAPLSLFVLARDPAGGPPLAVQRHSSSDLPLTVELTEADAMVPTRSVASAPRVQVVARLSRSGTPQAQSGDFFGQADYEFGKDTGTLKLRIDQVVP